MRLYCPKKISQTKLQTKSAKPKYMTSSSTLPGMLASKEPETGTIPPKNKTVFLRQCEQIRSKPSNA